MQSILQTNIEVSAIVTRADGTVEDLGVISSNNNQNKETQEEK